MRHLKTYEEINISIEKLPNYMIITADDDRLLNRFYILEIVEIVENDRDKGLKVIKLYTYIGNELRENENKYTFDINFTNKLLKNVYESDNLEDCINMVKVISNTKKYNI